jgi:hypothetical protein
MLRVLDAAPAFQESKKVIDLRESNAMMKRWISPSKSAAASPNPDYWKRPSGRPPVWCPRRTQQPER